MKRSVLHVTVLLFTFAIGMFVNSVVLRAAYYFIPDFDPLPPKIHYHHKPHVKECRRNNRMPVETDTGHHVDPSE